MSAPRKILPESRNRAFAFADLSTLGGVRVLSFPRFVLMLLWMALLGVGSGNAAWAQSARATLNLPREIAAARCITTNAFPGLQFESPIALVTNPKDSKRLFVVERAGRVMVLDNLEAAVPARSVFLDLSDRVASNYTQAGNEGLNGIAFHPGFATNGWLFVTYTAYEEPASRFGQQNRLSRFQMVSRNGGESSGFSELILLAQPDEGFGHNWNDLLFGPDGYLYVTCGDEGESHDKFQNSARIDKDFFSGVLRLDVDERPENLTPNAHPAFRGGYRIPRDNPFVGMTRWLGTPVESARLRSEFWAVGLRNPWRLFHDAVTGNWYCADIGQHAVEEINLLRAGGNYGWAFREGKRGGFRGDPPPGANLIPPMYEYSHGFDTHQGNCVIGGLLYRGSALPSLTGSYVFGDFISGHLWSLRHDGNVPLSVEWLATDPGITGFALDPRDGGILLVDHAEGVIKRLASMPAEFHQPPPGKLSETGAFTHLPSLTPAPGVFPYEVNVPMWSDGAHKRRWFTMPEGDVAMQFAARGPWQFPAGATWIKHFEIDLREGNPRTRRKLETRVLVRTSRGAYGLSYRWNAAQTEAELVPENGAEDRFLVTTASGLTREQTWRYPSRNECLACHTPAAGFVLGFDTAQLNRLGGSASGGLGENQLALLSRLGCFENPGRPISTLPSLAEANREEVSREYRVRSYLHANCASCHRPGGPTATTWDARIETPTSLAGIIQGPLRGGGGNPKARIIVPGSPEDSELLSRITQLGPGHMPPLGTSVVNEEAIRMLRDWIVQDLPHRPDLGVWQTRHFNSVEAPTAQPQADPDGDGASNYQEFLTSTDPLDRRDVWSVSARYEDGLLHLHFDQQANRAYQIQSTARLGRDADWQPLDHIDNAPFFSATNRTHVVVDKIEANRPNFYRVHVFEP